MSTVHDAYFHTPYYAPRFGRMSHRSIVGNIVRSFTLIELLVVISIIGLLSSVVFASIGSARGKARDTIRIQDMNQIALALERYSLEVGAPPVASAYGEQATSPGWWDGWWDLSTYDRNGDGNAFMDFLRTAGYFATVPVDPLNDPSGYNGQPYAAGHFYVYYNTTASYGYQGGPSCAAGMHGVWLIGIRDLENSPAGSYNSGCTCLWRDNPNMFQGTFDYIRCGVY